LGGQDCAAQTKATLRPLLVDEGLLQRVRPPGRTQPFQPGDLYPSHRPDRCATGPDRAPRGRYCAAAAPGEPTAELWPAQVEVVAEHVQQRRCRIHVYGMRATIDGEGQCCHIDLRLRS